MPKRVGVSVWNHNRGAPRSWEASQRSQMRLLDTYKTVNGTRTDRIDQVNCDVHEEDCEDEGQHRGGGWQEALDATAQARGAWKNATAAQSADQASVW